MEIKRSSMLKSFLKIHEVMGIKDYGEGVVSIYAYRPLLTNYFLDALVMLKRANPSLVVTAMFSIHGRDTGGNGEEHSSHLVELVVNFEEKIVSPS